MLAAGPVRLSGPVDWGAIPPRQEPRRPDIHQDRGFYLGYQPVLDGLRGLAVLAVMTYHSDLRSILRGGFLGVDLFFVLSGFLITVLLLQEYQRSGSLHLGRFYLRRMLRLFPALLIMLAACCVFAALRTRPARAQGIYQAALLTLCYGANWDWYWSVRLDLLGHAWSLGLEEQFYLLWPLVLFIMLRLRVGRRSLVWLVLMGMTAAALARAGLWLSPWPIGARVATTHLLARADALLAGCLVGLLAFNRLPRTQRPRWLLQILGCVSALVLVCLVVRGEAGAAYLYLGGFTLTAASAATMIAALMSSPPCLVTRVFSAPVLVWTGRISYGLYLWHFPLLSIAPKLMHGIVPASRQLPCLNGVLAFALAFGAASISYYGVEQPFLRWKARLGRA